ncbi:uncharacterized protein LOC123577936 isoform X2 [Leopardus geoffroyi]|uniref:uncharacterized protein LOC123577936 isoform X2 n=1 Tax=Leopardus geoffroyi TaxID=46844 RepID=UPI001E264329|nr:uncharacterized protein LOC123577936 isoform X2 [Leopardus geoffroyi]
MARAMLTAETRASGSATLPVLLCAGARTGTARPGVRSARRVRWRRPRAGTRLRGSSVLPVSGPWTLLLAPAPQVCAVAGKAESRCLASLSALHVTSALTSCAGPICPFWDSMSYRLPSLLPSAVLRGIDCSVLCHEVAGVEETTRRSISVGVPQVRTPRQVCLPRRPAPRRYEASSRGTFMCTREHIPRGGCTPMGQVGSECFIADLL